MPGANARSFLVHVRLPHALLELLDKWAKDHKVDRSAAIRAAISAHVGAPPDDEPVARPRRSRGTPAPGRARQPEYESPVNRARRLAAERKAQ
jgi:hypothetical protein